MMCNPQALAALSSGGVQQPATPAVSTPNLAGAPTVANAESLKYNTPLSPAEEQQFQAWTQQHGASADPNYDMRGYWKAQQAGDQYAVQGDNGHYPDTFKKPGHMTFSDESQYSGKDGNVGGHWTQDAAGNWVGYEPSETNLKAHTPQQMQTYFNEVEPETQLQLPAGSPSPVGQIFSRGIWQRR